MILTLRYRIYLTLVPLLTLLAVVGGAGVVLLYRLGGSIDLILHENYASVIAMERLNEALERIDSSFQFALAGKGKKAREQYQRNWQSYRSALQAEEDNITLAGEGALVGELSQLTERYRTQGDDFYARPPDSPDRRHLYFGSEPSILGASVAALGTLPPESRPLSAITALLAGKASAAAEPVGLLRTFEEIKRVSGHILRINQENMEQASRESRNLATGSLFWFAVGLAVAVLLAVLLALHTIRSILQPIQAVTRSAVAIGLGNLDQVVPVTSRDEVGQLADAFNQMARQLRHYRQTGYARLLRAQRTSQATIDSFPDPVLVVDSEAHVEMANPAARRLLGIPVGQASQPDASMHQAGKPDLPGKEGAVLAWQPPESLREPLADALQKQRDYLTEGFDQAILLRYSGKDCFFLPRILSIRDPFGNTMGAAVLLQDVTRLQLLDQVKSNLVATVSHELKTPLTSIRLVVHLLLEEAAGPLTPKQMELLMDARDNSERLLATINNLLDLTRIERGQGWFETQPESPAALLQAAADAIRPRATDKDVQVQVETPPDLPPVEVNSQRFGHALNNLLDNAVTYTGPGGRITLSATTSDGTVLLSVADTGAGIPPEHLPHVFERFFRVPGQSQGSGSGLGLAIVQEIVTAHGGAISCESEPGKGTVFRIALPLSRARSGSDIARDGVGTAGRSGFPA